MTTNVLKTGKCVCNLDGFAFLHKSKFHDWISVQKESPNFFWLKSRKEYTKSEKTSMCVAPKSHQTTKITFVLSYLISLMGLEIILKDSVLLDQFLFWEISTLEPKMCVKKATRF